MPPARFDMCSTRSCSGCHSGCSWPQLVRHEMAHVVTLDTADTARNLGSASHSWFTEGIAEYAAYQGQPPTANPQVRAAKSYITRQWAGDLTRPTTTKDPKAAVPAHIKYALGHMTVACLVQEYSFTSMLTLFNLLVRDDRDLDTAARAAFGSTWKTVNDHCADYIRTQLALHRQNSATWKDLIYPA
jgi:hypothetical protein